MGAGCYPPPSVLLCGIVPRSAGVAPRTAGGGATLTPPTPRRRGVRHRSGADMAEEHDRGDDGQPLLVGRADAVPLPSRGRGRKGRRARRCTALERQRHDPSATSTSGRAPCATSPPCSAASTARSASTRGRGAGSPISATCPCLAPTTTRTASSASRRSTGTSIAPVPDRCRSAGTTRSPAASCRRSAAASSRAGDPVCLLHLDAHTDVFTNVDHFLGAVKSAAHWGRLSGRSGAGGPVRFDADRSAGDIHGRSTGCNRPTTTATTS